MKGYTEALALLDQLDKACTQPAGEKGDSLSVFRLLHSLKSWAALHHIAKLEELCHRLEEPFRGGGAVNEAALQDIYKASADLRSLLANAAPGVAPATKPSLAFLRELALPALSLSAADIALIRDLQTEGRVVKQVRIWISPEETMLGNRIVQLQSLIEDHVLIQNYLWVWNSQGPQGPYDARVWTRQLATGQTGQALGFEGDYQGALYLALCATNPQLGELQDRIWIDQVEAIHESVLPPAAVLDQYLTPNGLELPRLSALAQASQELLFQQRRFMPGPRGFSVNSYLSFESSWPYQTGLLGDLQSQDAGDYVRKLFRQACELPLARASGDIAPTQWRLLVDSIRLPELVLRSLSDALVQLIRNSLAHGRESQTLRRQKRKSAAMNIHCSLMVEADEVVVEYSDDGKGINADQVLQKAGRSLGEPVTDDGLLAIISSPEFSTEDQAKANAGRGMGLNLVDHLVGQVLNGHLRLQNRLGKGCSFRIRFPRHLSVLDVVLCEGLTDRFAIPLAQCACLVPLSEQSIDHEEETQRFFRYAGRCIPFLRNDSLASPLSLKAAQGLILRRDGVLQGVIPIKRLLGHESLLITVDSASVFSRTLQSWLLLHGVED